MKANNIEIVVPAAQRKTTVGKLARRQSGLRGKTVGLLDNNKPNADRFLEYVAQLFRDRDEGIEIVSTRKANRTAADCLSQLMEKCDFVVNAFAD